MGGNDKKSAGYFDKSGGSNVPHPFAISTNTFFCF